MAFKAPIARARAPDGVRLVVIGDVHGHLSYLSDLLAQVRRDPRGQGAGRRDQLVFLGDYVDRGPESAGVIERLTRIQQSDPSAVFLKGNHEDMMLRFLDKGDRKTADIWLSNGGAETLQSYGVWPPVRLDDAEVLTASRQDFRAALPAAHRAFLDALTPYEKIGDFIFVHAGLRPGRSLRKQRSEDTMWIRRDFLDSREDFGGLVVHGHTPWPEPDLQANRIGLDTGAGKGGYLTAGVFWDNEKAFLHAGPRDGW